MRLPITLAILLIAIAVPTLVGQVPSSSVELRNSEGREFWLCFQKNYRDWIYNAATDSVEAFFELHLQLFLTAQQDTDVSIEIDGINFRRNVEVRAGSVFNVAIDSAAQVRANDGIERLAVHIVASAPIAVYGLNRRYQTTDTFLALPVSVLGTEYRVMAYEKKASDLLSQVAVVATEDDTELTVTPSVLTAGKHPPGRPYNIYLNRGDVYHFRAAFVRSSNCDLTGTHIRSNKKVAVFSGHNCAYIPSPVSYCNHLVEQMPPLNTWGRQFYIGNLAKRSRSSYRVLATEDETVVFENSRKIAVLDAGEFYETHNLTGNTQITATKPVLVALFSQGSQNGDLLGDPMMILVSPTQQFMRRYRFATPVNGAWRHYVNVVAPRSAVASMRIDDRPVAASSFEPFGKSAYMIARLQVPFGTHIIEGAEPFGLYSYGLGYNDDKSDAYGNMGGQLFSAVPDVVDTLSPLAEQIHNGDSLLVYVREERVHDSGLRSIDTLFSKGISLSLPSIVAGAPQAEFSAVVRQADAFAQAVITATDVAGNTAYFTLCNRRDNQSGEYHLEFVPGISQDCQPASQWYAGAYLHLDLSIHEPDFRQTSKLAAETFYSGADGLSLQAGLQLGRPVAENLNLSLSLQLDTYAGVLLASDSSTSRTPPPDLLTVQEGYKLDLENEYLGLALAGEYYASERFYLLAGMQISLALSRRVTWRRVILTPDQLQYQETKSPERLLFDGPLQSINTLRPAAFGGFGLLVPVTTRLRAHAELKYTQHFTDIIDDGSWLQRQVNVLLGLRADL